MTAPPQDAPSDEVIEAVAEAHYGKTTEIVSITRPGAPFMKWEDLPEEQRRLSMAGARTAIEAYLFITRRAEQDDGWQPIETAPKDGTWIIALADCGNPNFAGHGVVQWRGDGRTANAHGWYDDRVQMMDDATHWMPLPSPPHDQGPAMVTPTHPQAPTTAETEERR